MNKNSHDENVDKIFRKYSDYYKNKKYYWTTFIS
ncbi:unnamed protein product [Fructobacillus cardui]|nr:unnamed protein product [Fructobacillus cardui]